MAVISSITNTAQSISQRLYENMPSVSLNKVGKIALPIVAIIAMESLTGAEAGPISYTICVAGCQTLAVSATVATAGAGSPLILQCLAGCLPLLGLPVA